MKARTGAALLAGAALLVPASAMADTLEEALALAYQTNPTIQAARADLRATDENVPIEKSEGLPSIGGSAQYTEVLKQSDNSFNSPSRYLNAGIDLSVPVYSGGGVKNSIRAAKQRVEAGRADLKATESGVFARVVAAYMDVIRDSAVVQLNKQNVDTLGVNLQATRDRFEIGDLTRTDVAQSDSRLALAQSDYLTAQSNLIGSRERYIQLVGKAPVNLQPPPQLPGLPASPEDAVDVALANNPDLIAARERSEASRYDIEVAGSTRLPRVELFTSGGYTDYFGTLGGYAVGVDQSETTAQAGARLTVPIFPPRLNARRRPARSRPWKPRSRSSAT